MRHHYLYAPPLQAILITVRRLDLPVVGSNPSANGLFPTSQPSLDKFLLVDIPVYCAIYDLGGIIKTSEISALF